jgi:hypothetical protein
MATVLGHRHHPLLGHQVQRVPARQLTARDEIARDILAARFDRALRLGSLGPTQARRDAIVLGEIPTRGVPLDPPALPSALEHHRLGIVVQDRLGESAKRGGEFSIISSEEFYTIADTRVSPRPGRIGRGHRLFLAAHSVSCHGVRGGGAGLGAGGAQCPRAGDQRTR